MKKVTAIGLMTFLLCCATSANDIIIPVDPCLQTSILSQTATEVQTFTRNSNGNKPLAGSPYGYEMWTQGGNDNKLIWFGPDQGGGAAFRTEWNNPNCYLGRVGYFWGNGQKYTAYKNIYCDFNYTRSANGTAGRHSYVGIYGWARNPSAADPKMRLIEYYIVDDWFGDGQLGMNHVTGWEPDDPNNQAEPWKTYGNFSVDGGTYNIYTSVRVEKPSIDGNLTFTQYFSIRQGMDKERRQCGTISVSEHFKKWEESGLELGNMYEAKFLIEAGGGTGWLEATYIKLTQEDQPRDTGDLEFQN